MKIHQKHFFFILLLLFSSISLQAQLEENTTIDTSIIAQYKQTKPVNYIIKTNLLPILMGSLPLTSEYRLLGEFMVATNQSISISGSYLGKNIFYKLLIDSINTGLPTYIKGYRFQLAYKYYLTHKKFMPRGFYLSPHCSYSSADYSIAPLNNSPDYIRITNFNANLLFGFQMLAKNTVAFDLFTGIGYKNYTYKEYLTINKNKSIITYNPSELDPFYGSHFNFILIGFNFGITF